MKAISATPEPIQNIFHKEFIIPEFQRPYAWKEEQCEQLWLDISSAIDSGNNKNIGDNQYFLGSIVVYTDPGNKDVWRIIDGQQRLTTLLMLIRILFGMARIMTILERLMYKTDPNSGETVKNKVRLTSEVIAKDYENFTTVMRNGVPQDGADNIFARNYEKLQRSVREYFKDKPAEDTKKFIQAFLKTAVMLPIVCDSVDDALDLFQIINDRGMHLNDADIFKSELYKRCPDDKQKKDFIKRWQEIDAQIERWNAIGAKADNPDHEDMFRILMHYVRAQKGETDKEIALRAYIKDYLNKLPADKDVHTVISTLETIAAIHSRNVGADNFDSETDSAPIRVYWKILQNYPNIYWRYPLYVFLLKHGNTDGVLPSNMHQKYVLLLERTVRYFYIKGVVHNAANTVKDTTFKVYRSIWDNTDYNKVYMDNIKNDMTTFEHKLQDGNYKRYKNGLILISAFCNPKQDAADYATVLTNKYDIEHILPRKWRDHYDRWNKESHEEHVGTIGNLMPLENKCNIAALNEFFGRKQEEYEASKIQDALDLAQQKPSCWYPQDVQRRHKQSLQRLRSFFCEGNSPPASTH